MSSIYSFTANVRLRSNGKSPASWHLVTLPRELSDQIKQASKDLPRRGRGSLKVKVRIGYCTRQTSIFPDNKIGSYVLPIKKSIREELHIEEKSQIYAEIEIIKDVP